MRTSCGRCVTTWVADNIWQQRTTKCSFHGHDIRGLSVRQIKLILDIVRAASCCFAAMHSDTINKMICKIVNNNKKQASKNVTSWLQFERKEQSHPNHDPLMIHKIISLVSNANNLCCVCQLHVHHCAHFQQKIKTALGLQTLLGNPLRDIHRVRHSRRTSCRPVR